ncbi:hypothetical protein D3C71_1483290 [compost metagenome]
MTLYFSSYPSDLARLIHRRLFREVLNDLRRRVRSFNVGVGVEYVNHGLDFRHVLKEEQSTVHHVVAWEGYDPPILTHDLAIVIVGHLVGGSADDLLTTLHDGEHHVDRVDGRLRVETGVVARTCQHGDLRRQVGVLLVQYPQTQGVEDVVHAVTDFVVLLHVHVPVDGTRWNSRVFNLVLDLTDTQLTRQNGV